MNVYTIIIVVAISIVTSATAQGGNGTLKKTITVPANTIRVDSLLKKISTQTGIEFSFNPTQILPAKTLVVINQTQTLAQWLAVLHKEIGVEHKLLGNHIILVSEKRNMATINKNKPVKNSSSIVNKEKNKAPKKIEQNTATISTPQKVEAPSVQNSGSANTNSVHRSVEYSKPAANSPSINSPVQPDTILQQKMAEAGVADSSAKKNIGLITEESKRTIKGLNNTNAIQLVAGYSKHGSGDLKGIVFGAEYITHVTKRFSLNYNFRGSINHGKDEIIVTNTTTGTTTDASVRYTTAGVQVGVNAGYNIIRNVKHSITISGGIFGRYQSASNGSDGYSLYYPTTTGVPSVLIGYDNRTPQETFSIGGLVQLQYDFTFRNNVYIGIIPGFQTDTNGDAIPQVALTVGKRF